jgi:hypothetical protein
VARCSTTRSSILRSGPQIRMTCEAFDKRSASACVKRGPKRSAPPHPRADPRIDSTVRNKVPASAPCLRLHQRVDHPRCGDGPTLKLGGRGLASREALFRGPANHSDNQKVRGKNSGKIVMTSKSITCSSPARPSAAPFQCGRCPRSISEGRLEQTGSESLRLVRRPSESVFHHCRERSVTTPTTLRRRS